MTLPTIIAIPCLSGAPWDTSTFQAYTGHPVVTMTLSDDHEDIEGHADDVLKLAAQYDQYVLMGDSFGAQVALAAAARRPAGLVGLVISGGFAAMPVDSLGTRLKIEAARFLPGPLYHRLVVPMHAQALASRFDREGDTAWTVANTAQLFHDHTTWRGYVQRTQAALHADYRSQLKNLTVPTLILTPEDDSLIGPDAAAVLRNGIANASELVLPRTGHMFRFSHPSLYANAVREFFAPAMTEAA